MKPKRASWDTSARRCMPLSHALTAGEELLRRFAFEVELILDAQRRGVYIHKDYDTHLAWIDEQQARVIRRNFASLKRRKLVEERRVAERLTYSLTEKGRIERLRACIKGASRRTDGMFTLVVFDVPWGREKERKSIRRFLRSTGFRMLQQSVWISRSDISDPLHEWIHRSNLGAWIRVLLAKDV